MALIEINKGRGLTLPAAIRRKFALKPGAKLEVVEKKGSIELVPLTSSKSELFALIDKKSPRMTQKEITALIKRGRLHALLHRR